MVVAVLAIEEVGVHVAFHGSAAVALDEVIAGSAVQLIAAGSTDDQVVAISAADQVVVAALVRKRRGVGRVGVVSEELVVAGTAINRVIVLAAVGVVVAIPARDLVSAVEEGAEGATGAELEVAIKHVATAAAVQRVRVCPSGE